MLHQPTPLIPPVSAEMDAMSRHWDAMADSLLDFTTDNYERAKARFWAADVRLSKESAQ